MTDLYEDEEPLDFEAEEPPRFNILVCIDGSEEGLRGINYAVLLGKGTDADITFLYVRPVDKGMKSGVNMARQNMLEWGVELPGMRALKDARNRLVELGFMDNEWEEETIRKRVYGDPLGDIMKTYTNQDGQSIALKLMVSPTIASGILDEEDLNDYNLTIIAMSGDSDKASGKINWGVTRTVVTEHRGTIIVARDIKKAEGHLICVSDDKSIEAAKKDAILASRSGCKVHLLSVARDENELESAREAITRAEAVITEVGVKVSSTKTLIGDPVDEIIEYGKPFSLIAMADTTVKGFRRFFKSSVAYEVLRYAENSVMIIR